MCASLKRFSRIAALLLAAVSIGHAQVVFACAGAAGGSQRGPCCPPEMQQPAGADAGCDQATQRSSDCDSMRAAISAPTAPADQLLTHGFGSHHDAPMLLAAWPRPVLISDDVPRRRHRPPIPLAASLPGAHTYLATLRLRL